MKKDFVNPKKPQDSRRIGFKPHVLALKKSPLQTSVSPRAHRGNQIH